MCRCWPILAPVTLEQIGSDPFKLKELCSGAGTLARGSGGELQHALAWAVLFSVSPYGSTFFNPRAKTQEMRHWYESEEYQLEMTQRQLDFDEKNMSLEPGKSEWELGACRFCDTDNHGHSWGRQIESWRNLEMSQRQRLRDEEPGQRTHPPREIQSIVHYFV